MQKAQYILYANRNRRYWLDVEKMYYADFRAALRLCRRFAADGYVCWHIVRLGDGLVIAQSRNART